MAGLFDDLIPGAKPGAAGGLFADLIPAKPKPAGLLRSVADLGIEAASGVARGVKATADAFGADNAVSRGADTVDKFAREYLSAAAKADDRRVSDIMAAAQDAGVWEQVKAAAEAFAVKPGGFIMNSLGTAVPTIAATMIPGVGQAGVAARLGALGAMGAAQGAGAVKGSIYEAVKAEQIKAGASETEAEAAAVRAQEYGGENTANIAGGAALGGAASATGVQPVIAKMLQRGAEPVAQAQRGMLQRALNPEGLVARTGMGALKEAPLEAAQGGQEQYASNIALQREGFDTPAFRGVAGAAALEGLASAGPGAAFAALDKPATRAADEPKPDPVAQVLAAPDVDTAIKAAAEGLTGAKKPAPAELPQMDAEDRREVLGLMQVVNRPGVSPNVAKFAQARMDALLAPYRSIPTGEATEMLPVPDARELTDEERAEYANAAPFSYRRAMERGLPQPEVTELIPAGDATEVEPIPAGDAFEEIPAPEAYETLPTGEVSDLIPTADATEFEAVPAGDVAELDVETIQPTDLLAKDGEPFVSKTGAQARAFASGGGKVVAIPNHFGSGIPGYVVRPLMQARPNNTRGTDARDLPRSSNDDQRDLAGSAEQVPGASDGRGADAARSGGAVGLVPAAPGRVDQPAEAPSTGNRPADVVAGAGDADTALTPGSRVTLNGTPYTVTTVNGSAVKLQGADGGTKMVARNSKTFGQIQPEAAPQVSGGFNVPEPPTMNYRLKKRGGQTYIVPPVGQSFSKETRTALRDWATAAGFFASSTGDNEISVSAMTGGPTLDYIVDGVEDQRIGRQVAKERAPTQEPNEATRPQAQAAAGESAAPAAAPAPAAPAVVPGAGGATDEAGRLKPAPRYFASSGYTLTMAEAIEKARELEADARKRRAAAAKAPTAIMRGIDENAASIAATLARKLREDIKQTAQSYPDARVEYEDAAKEKAPAATRGAGESDEVKDFSADTFDSWKRQGMDRGSVKGWTVFHDHVTSKYWLARKVKQRNEAGGGFVTGRIVDRQFSNVEDAKRWASSAAATQPASGEAASAAPPKAEAPVQAASTSGAAAPVAPAPAERTPKAQAVKEALADDRQPFEHAGLKVYPTKMRRDKVLVDAWAVQLPENRGTGKVLGDTLHATIAEAKESAEYEARRDETRREWERKEKADAAEREAIKEANRGKTVAQRAADFSLNQANKLPPSAGLGTGTRREAMDKAVEQGRAVRAETVEDTAAKGRDKKAVEAVSKAGYLLGASNENIPVVKVGLEARARLKADKYEKTEYRVYGGRLAEGPFHTITKIEYDYAVQRQAEQFSAEQDRPAPAPMAVATHKDPGEPAEPVTPAVVREAIKTGVQATDRKPSAMKAELLAKIDAAMEAASSDEADERQLALARYPARKPTKDEVRTYMVQNRLNSLAAAEEKMVAERERSARNNAAAVAERIGYVTFSVPGDGVFKVVNTRDRLAEFRRKVEGSGGFKDRQSAPAPDRDGSEKGSGSKLAAFDNMVNEGDLEAASDYADAVGLELDPKKIANATKVLKWRETRPAEATPAPAAEAPAAAPAPAADDRVLTIENGGSTQTLTLPKPAWQATDEELVQAVKDSGTYLGKPGSKYDPYRQWREAHSDAITKAAQDGKTFPDELLYDKPALIRTDLNDDQADEASDAMVAEYRATKDYGKAVAVYREWGKQKAAPADQAAAILDATQAAPKAKSKAAPAPAAASAAMTGPRRDPEKVSMFNPYTNGDIVTIGGKDWMVKQDMPGWYLTSDGTWRGEHPTIKGIKAMMDLIREVEQAAQESAPAPTPAAQAPAGRDEQPPAEQAAAILNAAAEPPKGAERLSVIKDVKSGAITPEEVAAAYPAAPENDRDHFTLERGIGNNTLEKVTFARGEYITYQIGEGGKWAFGEIDGISHAKREFSVDGLWHPFGFAYKAERPAPVPKQGTEPLSKTVDRVNAKYGAGLGPADAVSPVEAFKAVMQAVYDGKATVEDYQAGYARVRDETAMKAELGKMTKDELTRMFGIMRDGKKDELVALAYSSMLRSFAMGKEYGPSGGYMMTRNGLADYEAKKLAALDELVAGQTADDLAAFAAEQKRISDERAGKRAALVEAVKDPKTLDDFRNHERLKLSEGMSAEQARLSLTPEQRALRDELAAEVTRGRRKQSTDEQRTTVRAAGQTTAGEIIATKHTRDGHNLWVVKLSDRVSKDDYVTLLAGAKRLGGNYSSFRGNGAVPGFQFRTPDAAQAFLKLAGGDTSQATEVAKERRNAFEDDRSQSAAERLTEMADRLDERADESLSRDRKANTDRRARFAASAEAAARADKAMAGTMRNIAKAITGGGAKFLDRVRQKVQVELLQTYVANGKYEELRAKYPTYAEQERHKGEPPTIEAADHAEFPTFTAYRSDLASLGRQLLEVDGTKKLGERIMKVADDVSDAFTAFAKEPGNLFRLSTFSVRAGDEVRTAIFPTREGAERAITRSGLSGKAIVFPEKRGVNRIIMSPSEAMARGIWKGDGDKRITLTEEFGNELVEKIGRAERRGAKVSVPWQFETVYDRRKQLSRMGIETPAEFRAALREFIAMREQPAEADKIKAMERAMVGRRNDGLDFFPTPESVADEMVAAADIQSGMRVLEPSAGMGHIAERIRATEVEPDVAEFSNDRKELLEAKGFNVVARDFMGLTEGGYDRILMNPPFSDGRDIQHVRHAYDLLKPGGRVVAIMGESAFFNQNKRATEFREWLDGVGGTSEKLPEGTFNDPSLPVQTGANARMVVIEKPAGEQAGDGAAQFSRSLGARTGVPMADAEAVADAIRAAYPTGPQIVVLDDVRKAPEQLLDQIRSVQAANTVEGAYYKGKIYLFPQNVSDIARLMFVGAHHEIRHAGLDALFGKRKGALLLSIAMSNPKVAEAARAKMADGLADSMVAATEEALADMPLEDMAKLNGWNKIVAAVRQWLRGMADKLRRNHPKLAAMIEPDQWTGNDVAALIRRAEDISRGGTVPARPGGAVFSDQDSPDWYSALADQVGKASMNAGPASAWKAMLKNWTTTGKVKADEVEWSGLNEWLDMQPGKITKAQVAEYLRGNGVQLTETTLTDGASVFTFRDLSGTVRTFNTESEAQAAFDAEQQWIDDAVDVRVYENRIEVHSDGAGVVQLYSVQEDGTWQDEQGREFDDKDDAERAAERSADVDRDGWRQQMSSAVEGESSPAATKYGNYTLPGGTNYREVLLTLPEPDRLKKAKEAGFRAERWNDRWKIVNRDGDGVGSGTGNTADEALRSWAVVSHKDSGGQTYKSGHWDQPNVLAHIRVNDRTDADGNRVLFVEELQSDYAQDARKKGIQKKPETVESLDDPRVRLERRFEDGKELTDVYLDGENVQTWKGSIPADYILADLNEVIEKRAKKGVPAAPYIDATDKWVALALKRVIKMAVDGGYDKVAFVTGEQSAERYDLSKQVSRVAWNPKTGELTTVGVDKLTMTDVATGVKAEQLADYIGKDAADKLIAADENAKGFKVIAGDDLKVGGSGMRAFYDKIVPAVAKDVLRKLGGGAMEAVKLNDPKLPPGLIETLKKYNPGEPTTIPQPGFAITQAMRDKARGGMPLFSRADQTQTPAFRRWFGNSRVVDSQGKPLVVYHGTKEDFSAFDNRALGMSSQHKSAKLGTFFSADPAVSAGFAGEKWEGWPLKRGFVSGAQIMPVYLSIKNPLVMEAKEFLDRFVRGWEFADTFRDKAIAGGHDGIRITGDPAMAERMGGEEYGADAWVAFRPEQIKSAIGNNGDFNPGSSDIRFSRAGTAKTTAQRQVTQAVRNTVSDLLGNAGAKVSFWDRTLGTQYAKAQKFPAYKRVFDAVQQYLEDTSAMANEAADQAKGILPKLETWKDLKNFGLKPADAKAIAAPIFEGTLTDQKVYDDAELAGRFKLTPAQIAQYKEFRAAVNTSLDQAMAAEALRMLGDKNAALRELALTDREALRAGVLQYLYQQAVKAGEDLDAQGADRGEFTKLRDDIAEKYDRIDSLKAQGYAPLMRFGQYKLNITDPATGQTLFFGLYESKAAANAALRDMQGDPTFEGADFEQGVLSREQYKLFSSMPLDSLEMFAEAIGADQSDVYQDFIRLAKSNRSAMKRLLKRKGTAGFSEDVPRVLAAFVTSNARMAAGALNMPTAKEAAQDIRDGDVQDEAIKLLDVVQNPTDTAGAVRSIMFVNFIGGSIASAVVNLTQPLTMTLPYLSQFGGGVKAAKRLMAAGKMAASGKVDDLALRVALKRAETDGIVSPQEIHHLTAQAMGTFGTHPYLQRAAFIWAAPFSLAEQFNRRVSFIAAFETAREQGIDDPFAFAEKAVTETQGLYNKGNAPNLARGTIGAAALTFKQFSIHYLEWMGRMSRSGPEGKKAVALALALLILAAGTDGLPFADDLDDLIDTLGQALGYDMNVKRARREFVAEQLGMGDVAADVMARGFSAVPGIPLDVSIRMSMGNLLPGTGMFLRSNTDKSRDLMEVAGPAGGLAKQYIEAGTKALKGDFGGAVQSALPVAFQNAFKGMDMWTTGEARDTLGRKVMDADEVDGLMKFIGFQPQAIARESEKIQMIRDSEQLAKNVEGEIASAWARAVVDKDPDGVADARAKLAQWNEDNPESPIRIKMQQIVTRAKKLREDRASRFITSVSPERRRAVAEALD